MFFKSHDITIHNNPNKELVHYKPFNDNSNVKCLHGSIHVNRTIDWSKVTCPKCLDPKVGERFWYEHEQKKGNEHKNF